MKNIKYAVYKEGEQYVSQCLNVDVASCGFTVDEAVSNLIEAVELFFEEPANDQQYMLISDAVIGESTIRA